DRRQAGEEHRRLHDRDEQSESRHAGRRRRAAQRLESDAESYAGGSFSPSPLAGEGGCASPPGEGVAFAFPLTHSLRSLPSPARGEGKIQVPPELIVNLPPVQLIRQIAPQPKVADVVAETRKQWLASRTTKRIKPGMKIAVGCGSRGIK